MHRWSIALVAVALATALAQSPATAFTNAPMAYRVGVPEGWTAQASPDYLFVGLQPLEGSPHYGRASITVAVEAGYGGTLEQGIDEVLGGLRSGIPDLRVASRAPASVSGQAAAVVEVRGTLTGYDVSYRMAFLIADGRGYVIILETLTEHLAAAAAVFDQVVASFVVTSAGAAPVPGKATPQAPGGTSPHAAPPLAPLPSPGAGAAAAVPDPCMLLTLLPGAATAGPPPGIVAGTRLVYYAAAASIPGQYPRLIQNPDGDIVDAATGRRFSRLLPSEGAGGEGYRVAQVGHVDADTVQVGVRFYLIDGGRSMYTREAGVVTHAGCAGEFWVHPAVLASLPDMDQSGVTVLRMPYRLGERTFDAIRIHTTTSGGFLAYVYDLASGLLIFSAGSSAEPGVLTPEGGYYVPDHGSTQLSNMWIVDVATVDVPWHDAPAPSWLGQVRTLDYQGTYSVVMSGSPVFPHPVQQRLTFRATGRDWFQVQIDSTMTGLAAGTYHDQATMTYGRASIAGPWLAPEALQRLAAGQIIDRCDVVGYVTSVSAAGPGGVTISEVGPMHRRDSTYDLRTGMLVASDLVQQIGLAQHVLQLRLVGGP